MLSGSEPEAEHDQEEGVNPSEGNGEAEVTLSVLLCGNMCIIVKHDY